jgi:deoxycytidine triphosphate deaminase
VLSIQALGVLGSGDPGFGHRLTLEFSLHGGLELGQRLVMRLQIE